MLLVFSLIFSSASFSASANDNAFSKALEYSDYVHLLQPQDVISIKNGNRTDENQVDTFPTNATTANNATVDSIYSVTLDPHYSASFSFTVPTTGYYTVETYPAYNSMVDTFLEVQANSQTYTDDESGTNFCSCIGIRLTSGQSITANARLFDMSKSGQFYFAIRYQRANIFTYNYNKPGMPDIDTTPDSIIPAAELTSLGYRVNDLRNSLSIFNYDTFYSRLNSEAFFFSGHGAPGLVLLQDTAGERGLLQSDGIGPTNNTKLAVWAACNSAAADPSTGLNSIAQQTFLNGAQTSIGWTEVTYVGSSRMFTNVLYQQLANGVTVSRDCEIAANQFSLPFENIETYMIFGNRNLTIATPSISPRNMQQSVSQKELDDLHNALGNGYSVAVQMAGDTVRYYKTINNLLTNDFYDVTKDMNGNIVQIEKSSQTIQNQNILSKQEKNFVPFDVVKYVHTLENENTEAKEYKENDVYFKIDGELVPLKILYITMRDIKLGYNYLDVKCINMNNGAFVDYESICLK